MDCDPQPLDASRDESVSSESEVVEAREDFKNEVQEEANADYEG